MVLIQYVLGLNAIKVIISAYNKNMQLDSSLNFVNSGMNDKNSIWILSEKNDYYRFRHKQYYLDVSESNMLIKTDGGEELAKISNKEEIDDLANLIQDKPHSNNDRRSINRSRDSRRSHNSNNKQNNNGSKNNSSGMGTSGSRNNSSGRNNNGSRNNSSGGDNSNYENDDDDLEYPFVPKNKQETRKQQSNNRNNLLESNLIGGDGDEGIFDFSISNRSFLNTESKSNKESDNKIGLNNVNKYIETEKSDLTDNVTTENKNTFLTEESNNNKKSEFISDSNNNDMSKSKLNMTEKSIDNQILKSSENTTTNLLNNKTETKFSILDLKKTLSELMLDSTNNTKMSLDAQSIKRSQFSDSNRHNDRIQHNKSSNNSFERENDTNINYNQNRNDQDNNRSYQGNKAETNTQNTNDTNVGFVFQLMPINFSKVDKRSLIIFENLCLTHNLEFDSCPFEDRWRLSNEFYWDIIKTEDSALIKRLFKKLKEMENENLKNKRLQNVDLKDCINTLSDDDNDSYNDIGGNMNNVNYGDILEKTLESISSNIPNPSLRFNTNNQLIRSLKFGENRNRNNNGVRNQQNSQGNIEGNVTIPRSVYEQLIRKN